MESEAQHKLSHGKLAMGTVQLGLPYGIANTHGQPSTDEAAALVQAAISSGITLFDTARAYGTSEQRLGASISSAQKKTVTINTKLSPLSELEADATAPHVRDAVIASVEASLSNLGLASLPVLLLHRWEHFHAYDGLIWDTLLALQASGTIGRLGVSVSTPEEALAALDVEAISYIQLPLNLLDYRWREAGVDKKSTERGDVTIQARSCLLQGCLVSDAALWPDVADTDCTKIANLIQSMADQLGRASKADLCYAYVRSLPWVGNIVVGMETKAQLEENVTLFDTPLLTARQLEHLEQSFAGLASETLLNPALWPK
ncbi:MAG: aldo/keto reductase [Alphaproteobacteria bacterium]|nr:aldo/keto reductase [Alphaproteobacteria bacterium]